MEEEFEKLLQEYEVLVETKIKEIKDNNGLVPIEEEVETESVVNTK